MLIDKSNNELLKRKWPLRHALMFIANISSVIITVDSL